MMLLDSIGQVRRKREHRSSAARRPPASSALSSLLFRLYSDILTCRETITNPSLFLGMPLQLISDLPISSWFVSYRHLTSKLLQLTTWEFE